MLPRLELKSASIADPVPDALNLSGSGDAVGFFSRSRARRFLGGYRIKKGLKYMRATSLSSASEVSDGASSETGAVSEEQNCLRKLIEVVGALAGVMTTASFLPQVIEIRRTGDTSGLSLTMYIVFVTGVALWIAYGVCKKSPSLVAANAITLFLAGKLCALSHSVSLTQKKRALATRPPCRTRRFILLMLIKAALHTASLSAPPPARIAVCVAGAVSTFAHPRVLHQFQANLIHDGWDVFAALQMDAVTDRSALLRLANSSLVDLALLQLGVVDSVLLEHRDVPSINCSMVSIPPSLTLMAWSVQRCFELLEEAEQRLNRTYSHIIRVRPDHLWSEALPDQSLWPKAQVLAPPLDIDEFAIVPRRLAPSYFKTFELLQKGCPLLRGSTLAQWQRKPYCPSVGIRTPACLFHTRFAVDDVMVSHAFCDGSRVRAPSIARTCSATAMQHNGTICI